MFLPSPAIFWSYLIFRKYRMAKSRSVDPHWFIWGSWFGCSILAHCGSWSPDSGIWWPKIVKFIVEENSYFSFKNCSYFFLSLHEGLLSQEKPPTRKTKHPALQNSTFLHLFLFLHVILPTWIRGSESSRPKTMRIRIHNTDKSILFFSNIVESFWGFLFSISFLLDFLCTSRKVTLCHELLIRPSRSAAVISLLAAALIMARIRCPFRSYMVFIWITSSLQNNKQMYEYHCKWVGGYAIWMVHCLNGVKFATGVKTTCRYLSARTRQKLRYIF